VKCFFIGQSAIRRHRNGGFALPESPRPRGRPRAFNDTTDQTVIRALDRGLEMLGILAAHPGRSLSELAALTAEAPATVYRTLQTLAAHGMAETDEGGQMWHVGPGAFRVGSAFLRRTKVVERSRAPMDALMRATGETANLGVESRDEVLFLSQVETHEAIRAFFAPGTKAPMHVSGIGKALLAFYPPERVAGIVGRVGLSGFTRLSITSPEVLAADLGRTRARGFAIDDQERAEGMRCVAAPIFNGHGEPVAGLSVSGPAFRMGLDTAAAIGLRVRAAADEVTRAIAGTPPERV